MKYKIQDLTPKKLMTLLNIVSSISYRCVITVVISFTLFAGTSLAGTGRPVKFSKMWLQQFFSIKFKQVRFVKDLPQEIRINYGPNPLYNEPEMSDPKGPFNSSDVHMLGDRRAGRRLISAGVGRSRAYVWLEQGGWGYSTPLELYQKNSSGKFVRVVRCNSLGTGKPELAITDDLRSHLDRFQCDENFR